ncbi:MAG: PBP1A family penicillin-binding protein [Acidobacteriota bacterium]|nr:PBP1A family penicillin-binding protein [Acidobacteriota bacterium]
MDNRLEPELRPDRTRVVRRVIFGLALVAAALVGALAGLLVVYSTDLPQVTDLERYRPSSITELYDQNGAVIGSFALQRRVIARYEDYPKVLRDAIISTEDKDFEKHLGIDPWRILGAAYRDLASGSRAQGASTLTMQLSRNLFLTADRKFGRKIQEIMLSIQIERRFTKEQIFTLYANQIFLGHGVYGFEAGSEFYFSKPAKDLTIEEAALLAGLPKAPSSYSPINNPEKALHRRNLVINNMMEDGRITAAQAQEAKSKPIVLHLQQDPNNVAPYFVEETRRLLEKKFGTDEVHEGGLRVYTTLDSGLQKVATRALLDGLAAYERRHGWKGHVPNVIAAGEDFTTYEHGDWLHKPEVGSYFHALVTKAGKNEAEIKIGKYTATIHPADMIWTQYKTPGEILATGDIVYVRVTAVDGEHHLQVALEQDSGAQGALVAIDNNTGEIRAMVGGRDFDESKFNRATQALRQTGSSFKPYVYSAAVEAGAMPDDTIVDAPISFPGANGVWAPHNYDNKYEGTISLRHALADSRNIPAIKLAQRVGIKTVIEYVHKFGITSEIQPYLPVALGSAEVTLLEHTAAYSTFPNDGVRLSPHYIRKVTDYDGHAMEQNIADVRDVISEHSARVMVELLRGVVLHGTGYAASKLNHPLGGKTGTTNDFTDAWFMGFSPSITCGVWVGYDEKKTLGAKETGAQAALPIWIEFMKAAIAAKPDEQFPEPPPDAAGKGKGEKTAASGDGESH